VGRSAMMLYHCRGISCSVNKNFWVFMGSPLMAKLIFF
jgi:hypothetical protein